jgi:hypothetical protein
MLIITAIVIPVILYFNFNPNPIATVVIVVGLVVGFLALRVSQYRRIFRWLRSRDTGTPAAWVPPQAEGSEAPAQPPAYYWSGGKDRPD